MLEENLTELRTQIDNAVGVSIDYANILSPPPVRSASNIG